jgi:hypothetical protein
MDDPIQQRLDDYSHWLRNQTRWRPVNAEWVEITTPFLDRHNDYLQIYVKQANGRYTLTDDGYTLQDLLHSGYALDSPEQQALLQTTLAGFGIQQQDGRLEIEATPQDFAPRLHDLIQAMLAVNNLFYLVTPSEASAVNSFRQGWQEAMENETLPLSELWEDI